VRPASRLAIVPNATHYTLAVNAMLPGVVDGLLAPT